MHFTVIFEREEESEGYHAYVPALRGCHSQGDTIDEAMSNIKEAIELYIETLKAHGEEIPQEDILVRTVEVAA